jgi:hypothetical protein
LGEFLDELARAAAHVKGLGSVVVVSVVFAVSFTGAAAADSLVFIKANNVWIANANGSNQQRVTRDGTARYPYESPSQADDGTIVAVRRTATTRRQIYRMQRSGRLLNRPISTPAPGTGAIDAKVSPNGKLVAYWFSTAVPGSCPFCINAANQALISYSYKFTSPYAVGTPNTGGWPSWIGNDTLVLTSGSAELWYYRLGMREARPWFADYQTGGGTPIPTLLDAEVSRDGRRLAVVRGNNQETVALYAMNGRPPAFPSPFTGNCGLRGGPFRDPTWSSNSKLLAVQDRSGIWEAAYPSLTSCGRPRLVVPGGSQPDFGTR